jgi:hypothetical protein
LFVNYFCESEVCLSHVVNWVEHFTTTSKWNSFTISLFSASYANNSCTSEDFKWWWVNTFLVDNNEVFVCSITKFFLEFDNLVYFIISECAFARNKFFSLISVGPKETWVNLGLFIF